MVAKKQFTRGGSKKAQVSNLSMEMSWGVMKKLTMRHHEACKEVKVGQLRTTDWSSQRKE